MQPWRNSEWVRRWVIAERFTRRPEQRQQRDGQRVQQPHTVAPVGRADVYRSQAHAEAQILAIAQPALDGPATGEAHHSPSLADFKGRAVVLNLWATWLKAKSGTHRH